MIFTENNLENRLRMIEALLKSFSDDIKYELKKIREENKPNKKEFHNWRKQIKKNFKKHHNWRKQIKRISKNKYPS
jgi:hypothetical protein